jgi:hypothetical protein
MVFERATFLTAGSSAAQSGFNSTSLNWPEFPGRRGKKQGIMLIQPFSAKIRLENIPEYSGLRPNSLLDSAGKFLARAGNYF